MIIFLYGPDDYRREQKKKFYIEEFKKKYSSLSVGHFDFSEEDALDDFVGFIRGQSIFEEKNLAVIESFGEADGGGLVKVLRLLVDKESTSGGGSGRTIILCSYNKKPPKTLSFLLKKPTRHDLPRVARIEEFKILSGAEWLRFIDCEAKKLGFLFEPAAKSLLAEVYAGNTWGLITELEKLSTVGKKIVLKSDLKKLDFETVPNYWVVMNSLRGARLQDRLRALENLFAQKEPPAKIFNILSSLWREKIPQMVECDFRIKSGKLDYEEALVDLLI